MARPKARDWIAITAATILALTVALDRILCEPDRRHRRAEAGRCLEAAKKWEKVSRDQASAADQLIAYAKTKLPREARFHNGQASTAAYLSKQAAEIARRYRVERDEWSRGHPSHPFTDAERDLLWRTP